MAKYRTGNSGHKIEIEDGWRVLDIGSGHNPHPRADILMDRELGTSIDRSGKSIRLDKEKPFILADSQFLPFRDKVFDYVIASHIAEHMEEPKRFCKELIRVSQRGYIETPSKLTEIFLGEAFHRWYVYHKGSTLTFEKKRRTKPTSELFYRFFYYDIERVGHKKMTLKRVKVVHIMLKIIVYVLRRLWVLSGKITYTCFEWEQPFDFKVKI